ncbi:MAG: hypothetical protein KY464_01105 [Gemmatimonadetes bacterium]|nr:hypothetical protein [Gemmatimonadota bacterium]
MGTVFDLLVRTFVFSFIFCCVVSGMLQLLAFTRHSRSDVPFSIRALWRPEEHFDAVGRRQIALARRLLTIGGVAYLSYGVLVVVANVL